MPRIKTESLQAGMVVASDVKNIDSMLLVPAGCALTERQINILQAWGIGEVEVEAGANVEETEPLSRLAPEELARLSAEIRAVFWQPDESNPAYAEVFKLMLQRRVRKTLAS
jgi:hypothetical protein